MKIPLLVSLVAALGATGPALAASGGAGAPDVNGDGKPDITNILEAADKLAVEGVVFDEGDPQGDVPVKRKDGKYHMCCIDLVTVGYRAAGYDLPSAIVGGPLLVKNSKTGRRGAGAGRAVTAVIPLIKKNPTFRYIPGPGVNPRFTPWKPQVPFRVGDIVFVHYDDGPDRHSGIVSGVDPATGLPSYITQISLYSENNGLHRSTFSEFFSLRCRLLTGYGRPVAWDTSPMSVHEKALHVAAVEPRPRTFALGGGAFNGLGAAVRTRLGSRWTGNGPAFVPVAPAGTPPSPTPPPPHSHR